MRAGHIEYAEPQGEKVYVRTLPCVFCGKQHEFTLDNESYVRWQYGQHLQGAFPDMSTDDREILISGTCPDCWDKHMKDF